MIRVALNLRNDWTGEENCSNLPPVMGTLLLFIYRIKENDEIKRDFTAEIQKKFTRKI